MSKTLEEGKSYVTTGGHSTGVLVRTDGDNFRGTLQALAAHCAQVWHSDGRVYAAKGEEDKLHTIDLTKQADGPARWTAKVTYRLANGFVAIDHHEFEEFDDLGLLIEGGRDFHTVEEITIKLNSDHLAKMYERG